MEYKLTKVDNVDSLLPGDIIAFPYGDVSPRASPKYTLTKVDDVNSLVPGDAIAFPYGDGFYHPVIFMDLSIRTKDICAISMSAAGVGSFLFHGTTDVYIFSMPQQERSRDETYKKAFSEMEADKCTSEYCNCLTFVMWCVGAELELATDDDCQICNEISSGDDFDNEYLSLETTSKYRLTKVENVDCLIPGDIIAFPEGDGFYHPVIFMDLSIRTKDICAISMSAAGVGSFLFHSTTDVYILSMPQQKKSREETYQKAFSEMEEDKCKSEYCNCVTFVMWCVGVEIELPTKDDCQMCSEISAGDDCDNEYLSLETTSKYTLTKVANVDSLIPGDIIALPVGDGFYHSVIFMDLSIRTKDICAISMSAAGVGSFLLQSNKDVFIVSLLKQARSREETYQKAFSEMEDAMSKSEYSNCLTFVMWCVGAKLELPTKDDCKICSEISAGNDCDNEYLSAETTSEYTLTKLENVDSLIPGDIIAFPYGDRVFHPVIFMDLSSRTKDICAISMSAAGVGSFLFQSTKDVYILSMPQQGRSRKETYLKAFSEMERDKFKSAYSNCLTFVMWCVGAELQLPTKDDCQICNEIIAGDDCDNEFLIGSAAVEEDDSTGSNELTIQKYKQIVDNTSEVKEMDFKTWTETNNLDPGIKSRLEEEGLTDLEMLEELTLDDIDSLGLNPRQKELLGTAIHRIRNDNLELNVWAAQNKIDTKTVHILKSGGFESKEKLKKATDNDLKRLKIILGQRKLLAKGIAKLNDTEFVRHLKDKGVKEETIAKLIECDYDSQQTIVLMQKENIELLQLPEAQQMLLSSIIRELKDQGKEAQSTSYEAAYEHFLKEIGLEYAAINKLKRFGMDSPEAMMILNEDIGTFCLSSDQRSILDDAIEKLKQFHQDPQKVLQSQRNTSSCAKGSDRIWNTIVEAYLGFVAKIEGVTKPASSNLASYMGTKCKPDAITMENGMIIVKLPVRQVYVDEESKIRKCIIGTEKPREQVKTIMLVGATGAGKSSLINGLCNYIFDTKWEETYRFKLIDEHRDEIKNAQKGQTMSQTEWITIYTISSGDSNKIPYTLNLIDTPGFGDTRGITRDDELVEQIRSLFKNNEKHAIDSIDAVCFVAKAPDARLTPTQRYIFSSIMSVFGKDIEKNIVVMITFGDAAKPPVLEAINEAKLPYRKKFKFNSSALFANNGLTEDLKSHGTSTEKMKDVSTKFNQMFWSMGIQSFTTFFEFLKKLIPKSLYLTNMVLEQRRILKEILAQLEDKVRIGLSKMDDLKQQEKVLRENENWIKENKDFEYMVTIHFLLKLPCKPFTFVTHCMKCRETCHTECTIEKDENKSECDVIDKITGQCMSCKGKCHWKDHKHTGYSLTRRSKQIKQTLENKQKEFTEATEMAANNKLIIEKLRDEYKACEEEVRDYVNRCRDILETLKRIALKPGSLTEV